MNLSVKKGEILGFLGINGAGKTTTIKMLLGMITPTSGQCYIQGQKVDKSNINIWNNVGYIVEIPHSYPDLTVKENLEIVRKLRGIEDKSCIDWILKKLKLKNYEYVKVKHLSLGNSQRLGIAKAIIHRPKVLILDEPTNGLDPAGIVEIRTLIMDLVENSDVTVFISSHKLEEISKMSTNIAIIHSGKLIKNLSIRELENQLKKSLILDGKDRMAMKTILTKAGYKVHTEDRSSTPLQILDDYAVNNPDRIAKLLVDAGYPPTLLKVEKEDLEMYFLRIITEIGGNIK